jgi:hypothetical protein
MAISSLLITLDPAKVEPEQTVQALDDLTELTLGAHVDLHVPAVLDTPTPQEDRRAIERIGDLPGVAKVDVISIFLDDDTEAPPRRQA